MTNLSTTEMNYILAKCHTEISTDSIWLHYKGGVYSVIDLAIDTTNSEPTVLYKRINGPGFNYHAELGIVYTRPYNEWFEMVKTDNDTAVPRFKKLIQCKAYVDEKGNLYRV